MPKAVAAPLKSIGSKPSTVAGRYGDDRRAQRSDVLAVVGSRDFTEQGFNRAVDAKRPSVGSLLKPFVCPALAQPDKWSLASAVSDAPVTVSSRAAAATGSPAIPTIAAMARCA